MIDADNIMANVSLSKYTTLGVGGVADYFVNVKSKQEFVDALNYAFKEKINFVVLGGGSNVLISDEGFRGLVVLNKASNYTISQDVVESDSGVNLSRLARASLEKGLTGLAFAVGIPGTLGGAIIGNAGSKYGQISDVLMSIEVWIDGKVSRLGPDALDYGYRTSNLRGKSQAVVLSAKLKTLDGGDLEEANRSVAADLERRRSSYFGKTAGSYFKNPQEGPAAAQLIDFLGLKGYRIGGAEISKEHANVFRNAGEATAEDFIALEEYVIEQVKNRFNVVLEVEVLKVGDFTYATDNKLL